MSAHDIHQDLVRDSGRMKDFAHDTEHYIFVDEGQSAELLHPAHLVWRQRVEGWETQVKVVYSVDVSKGRAWRHLSVQISVPGVLTQAELRANPAPLLELYEPIVKLFLPFQDQVAYRVQVSPPVPVVDPRDQDRQLTFRTPVTMHFLYDTGENVERGAAEVVPVHIVAYRAASEALQALAIAPPELLELSPEGRVVWRETLFSLAREASSRVLLPFPSAAIPE